MVPAGIGGPGLTVPERDFNTPVREPWNAMIYQSLKAIDRHNQIGFSTGDRWHFEQAQALRAYVSRLKDWIHRQEGR